MTLPVTSSRGGSGPWQFRQIISFRVNLALLRLDLTPAAAPIGPWFEGSDLPLWTVRLLASFAALGAVKPQFRCCHWGQGSNHHQSTPVAGPVAGAAHLTAISRKTAAAKGETKDEKYRASH